MDCLDFSSVQCQSQMDRCELNVLCHLAKRHKRLCKRPNALFSDVATSVLRVRVPRFYLLQISTIPQPSDRPDANSQACRRILKRQIAGKHTLGFLQGLSVVDQNSCQSVNVRVSRYTGQSARHPIADNASQRQPALLAVFCEGHCCRTPFQ